MDRIIEDSLEQVRQLCKKGLIDQALPVLDKLALICPGVADDLLYEKAVLEFDNGRVKDALVDFITCYEHTGSEAVFSVIMSFSQSEREEFKERYAHNVEVLKEYPYVYGSLESRPSAKLLWKDDESIIFYNPEDDSFSSYAYPESDTNKYMEVYVILINVVSGMRIAWYLDACKEGWSVNGRKLPVYLYYKKSSMDILLQCVDLEPLLPKEKLVFLIGQESMESFFVNEAVNYPYYAVGDNNDHEKELVTDKLKELHREMLNESNRLHVLNCKYYHQNAELIEKHILSKKPRVLIITSLFTTALQYHAAFCAKNLRELGLESLVIKEKGKINSLRFLEYEKAIHDFKPDLIFELDHFRFESGAFMDFKELYWVSWIQDFLPYNMTADHFSQLTNRDILMVQYYHEEIKKRLEGRYYIDAPAPADDTIYKPYDLTEEEKEKYSCDICMVCHASDVDGIANDIINGLIAKGVSDAREEGARILQVFFDSVYEGEIYSNSKEIRSFLDENLDGLDGQWNTNELRDWMASEMIVRYNQPVYRQVLADWLIEAGYDNIKLWGNGWLNSPKYTSYAMGPAENGEVLAKINQAAKIVLGNNILISGAARTWETMLSGGFYLCNYVSPEDDGTDIRRALREGVDFIMFHDRQELLDYVDFYLNNEDKRQEMIRRGREAALEKMTYKKLMRRMLDEIPLILEKQGALSRDGDF